jgi:hypothetical protein
MIIKYDGGEYPFDFDDITIKQGLAIEKFMGCSFTDWGKRLQAGGDLRARQVTGWLILHPDGGVAIEDTDFKMVRLGEAIDEAFKAEEGPAAAPDEPVPTVAASTGQTPAAAADSSPASWQPSSAPT